MLRSIFTFIVVFLFVYCALWLFEMGGLETIQQKGLKHIVNEVWEGTEVDSTNNK